MIKSINSLNNGYVEGSFISLLEPVGAPADPKSVVRNLVAPRTCSPPNLVAPRTGSCAARPKIRSASCSPPNLVAPHLKPKTLLFRVLRQGVIKLINLM